MRWILGTLRRCCVTLFGRVRLHVKLRFGANAFFGKTISRRRETVRVKANDTKAEILLCGSCGSQKELNVPTLTQRILCVSFDTPSREESQMRIIPTVDPRCHADS
jgi:hypothetical protein